MGQKGGGRKGFFKAAAATKQPDAPLTAAAVSDDASPALQQIYDQAGKEDRAQPENGLSLPEAAPVDNETRGQMLQRHKKEIRLLKDAAKKAGKKHKDAADKLEADLEKRHEEQLAQRSIAEFGLADTNDEPEDGKPANAPQGPTRAQKRKNKAAAQSSQREQRIAEENASMGESDRAAEQRQLSELLAPLGLCIQDIPADGHCLYRALEDQLQQCSLSHDQGQARSSPADARSDGNAADHANGAHGYQELRASAAGYMRSHASDFEPFLDQGPGDSTEGQGDTFARYCDDVEKTAAWGGDMELNALAEGLQRHIQLHSVGMPPVEFGAPYKDKQPSLRVCFLRHAFGLGEHYNSVKRLNAQHENDEGGFETVGHEHEQQHRESNSEESQR